MQESRALSTRYLWFADQLLKERSEVNHGLAQVFGAGLAPRLKKSAFVSYTIIVENQWMIHRNICRTLFKITHWIATRGHHIAQQSVGVGYRASGAVNESRLDSAPGVDKTRPIAGSKRPDMQGLHSVRALIERRFCLPPAPAFFQCASIFGATKLSAQLLRPAFSAEEPNSNARSHHHENCDDHDDLCSADLR